MSIPVKFVTAAIKKSAVRRCYPEGEAGFRRDYPHVAEDCFLFALYSMSSGEMQQWLDRLSETGLPLEKCCVVAADPIGPFDRHPHFLFSVIPGKLMRNWSVRLVNDDIEVLAEDGAHLLRTFMRRGWDISFDYEGDER